MSESGDLAAWSANYFTYFTEIEDHFRLVRGTSQFLLSPLDWALIETWKQSDVPLEAVLRGIDEAFAKWRSRKSKRRAINSVAYCTQAVLEAAQRTRASQPQHDALTAAPFTAEELATYLAKLGTALGHHPKLGDAAARLQRLGENAATELANLEHLELTLAAIEEKVVAILRAAHSDDALIALRSKLNQELAPYRGKMTADQLAVLERRYLDTALLEQAGIPRMSLFYLH